jgi:hypothetical protein
VATIRQTIELLHEPGDVFEVRFLDVPSRHGKPHEAGGYFKDPAKAARLVYEYDRRREPGGSYIILNQPDPQCWVRSPEKITDYLKTTTSGRDIIRRRWVIVDCDPVRPSGVPATDAQLADAQRFGQMVKDIVAAEFGWPEPVEGVSGNGYALLFRADLQNTDQAKTLVSDVLNALQHLVNQKPDVPRVKVDCTMCDANRIIRLFGTMNRKGNSTDEQPHRCSRLVRIPDRVIPVTLEQLQELAARLPEKVPDNRPPPAGGDRRSRRGSGEQTRSTAHRLMVESWLSDRGFPLLGTTVIADGRTAYRITCPFDSSHTGTDASVMQAPDGQLSAKCFHDSCQGRGWQEFKEAIGPPDPEHYDPPLKGGPKLKGAGNTGREQRAFNVGPIRLEPERPYQTPRGKIIVPILIYKGDVLASRVTLSDSSYGRGAASKLIAKRLPEDSEQRAALEEAIDGIIADAVIALRAGDEAADGADERIADIVRRTIPGQWKLVHRTARGAWSEIKATEVTRSEFVAHTPTWLLAEAALAADAPPDRLTLLKAVRAELEICWADLLQDLPRLADADLGADTEAAARFHQAMVTLWTATMTFEVA